MPKTRLHQSEKRKEAITDAIWKFSAAFLQRGVIRNFSLHRFLASILYLMKNRYISMTSDVPIDSGIIISNINLGELLMKDTKLFEKWQRKIIHNVALVVLIPDHDPLAEIVLKNLELMKEVGHNPLPLFEFFETISENESGDLYYLNVLDLALSLNYPNYLAGQYSQPIEFGRLASKILDVKGKDIFNPFSGMMSYATSLEGYESMTGVEKDAVIWELSQFRMYLAENQIKTFCIHGDVCEWTDKKYDIIVSTPPLGLPLSLKKEAGTISADWVCLKEFEETTTDNGVLFTVVAQGILNEDKAKSRRLRQELTEKNFLDAVITLPANLLRPYTSVSLAALLLKKGRDSNAPVKMIDASSLINNAEKKSILDVERVFDCINQMPSENCAYISLDDIRNNAFSWSVPEYLNSLKETFPEGYDVIELGDIIESVRGEITFDEKKGHLARISGLSTNGADCIRLVEQFEESDELSHAKKITEPVILFSSVRELKPTYCEASKDKPLFIHPNVMAFRLRIKWVSPAYLCLELSRRFIQPLGSFLPRITRSVLLRTRIAIPALGEQRGLELQNNLFNEAADSYKLAKAEELGVLSVMERMKTEYINAVRMRKHDMMPYMRELGSVSRMMRKYVEMSDSVTFQDKMENLLNKYDKAYRSLYALLEVFSQEDKFGTPEHLNIDQFLRELVNSHDENNSNYTIEYYFDDKALQAYGIKTHKSKVKELSLLKGLISVKAELLNSNEYAEVFVDIARLDFERLVRNIIMNAETHGFTDSERHDYHLDINLTIDPEKEMFQIDFSNNGTPLPKGMDKTRYGISGEKAGLTGGTGHGGYIVKSTVMHVHGDYDIFMDDQNTVVRILLPISNNND